MGNKKNTGSSETFLQFLFGALAILVVRSLFENDNSKILSKKGSQMLLDKDKMKELHDKLQKMESNKENEIVFNEL